MLFPASTRRSPRASLQSTCARRSRRPFVERWAGILSVLLILASWATHAEAQPAPSPEEVQQAQSRWNEGKAAFDAGNYEVARIAFKQAYTVFPHPAFLQNLGEAELRTGRLVEAARHLSEYLRTGSSAGSAGQRDLVTKSLQKAALHLGAIVVDTNVTDAEVRVDDEVVGKTPLGSAAWYVQPGKHTVLVRREGYLDASQPVEVAEGPAKNVRVNVQPFSPPASGSAGVAMARPAAGVESHSADLPTSTTAETRSGGARTAVLLTGAGLTLVSAAIGTVFAIKSVRDNNELENAKAILQQLSPANRNFCNPPKEQPLSSTDAAACADASAKADTAETDQKIRTVSFVTAGVLGAATVATFFLWHAPKEGASAAIGARGYASEREAGLVVFGRF